MSDLSMRIIPIQTVVKAKHDAYMKRFGNSLAMVEGELNLARTRILAKMKLLVQVFTEAKVIDESEELVVSSRDGNFPMSMRIGKSRNPFCLYLLNNGKDIIISDSVGLAMTSATIDTRILLVTSPSRVYEKFGDVLNADFQWDQMAENMLDAIHETIYKQHDVVLRDLTGELG